MKELTIPKWSDKPSLDWGYYKRKGKFLAFSDRLEFCVKEEQWGGSEYRKKHFLFSCDQEIIKTYEENIGSYCDLMPEEIMVFIQNLEGDFKSAVAELRRHKLESGEWSVFFKHQLYGEGCEYFEGSISPSRVWFILSSEKERPLKHGWKHLSYEQVEYIREVTGIDACYSQTPKKINLSPAYNESINYALKEKRRGFEGFDLILNRLTKALSYKKNPLFEKYHLAIELGIAARHFVIFLTPEQLGLESCNEDPMFGGFFRPPERHGGEKMFLPCSDRDPLLQQLWYTASCVTMTSRMGVETSHVVKKLISLMIGDGFLYKDINSIITDKLDRPLQLMVK